LPHSLPVLPPPFPSFPLLALSLTRPLPQSPPSARVRRLSAGMR
jgi:hypothetical protein